jgi:HAD superfamily hydrolase (TIGR01459 family)
MSRPAKSIGEIADLYDAFLVDQWGVIHDGVECYPGASQALRMLTATKKPVIVLTNSSKSVVVNEQRLARQFGIERQAYSLLVSSAELLLRHLLALATPTLNLFVVADGTDASLLRRPALNSTSIEEADGIALLSVAPGESIADHHEWVAVGVRRALPLWVPSADTHSVAAGGRVVSGLHSITDAYSAAGGAVMNFGKPGPAPYEECRDLLFGLEPQRVLAIGDQLASDVLGAKTAGYSAALVRTGAAAIFLPPKLSLPDACQLADELMAGAVADWLLPAFR